ncbi:DEAD/DEAH box helicase family protein [Meiothermus hypogaeus]|uniref:Type III restriction endonuclease subunit R n=1 Tax=Meiothermus hypogaeus NBRC 106114 TaxID=1227553 RepID=A0A511QXT8_9DEIN|nr:DEAD/DEAH box helicase family protein [Meiothermus hypogaeus]GEM82200.1 type III restriction endonuclease subunit R [Meiothermus hypogaeus NBRC 106114]
MPRGRPRGSTAAATAGGRGRRANARTSVPFNRKLVLNQWLLGLFGVERFDQLAEHLKDEALEGLDENNVHRFHHALCLHLPVEKRPELPDELLLEYDQNIVSVTQRLNERRTTRGEPPIVWKYFQYLALLFTEIYLDRYFRDPRALLLALNQRIKALNESLDEADRIAVLDETADAWPQLNKIAFWMATGSGKTLLMHAHILQYRRFLETHGRARELSRIILLTPNEGLSQQHLREFEKAGIEAEIFNKDGRRLFAGQAVEILEVTKLKEEMGEKTVAVDAFEGNNLVLVDEGHRGASSGGDGAWMKYRNALCEKGFSFEYSATFGQAVQGNKTLTDLYARSTLFDYSYRWFYGDGFGKDYNILNLEDDSNAEWMKSYLTACLLAFFQQQRLHREREAAFRPFNIEKPLWIFVGGSVTATLATRDASDIVEILRFLSGYVTNRMDSIEHIRRVLHDGLVTATGKNLFAGRFAYLNTCGLTPAQIFDETLATLFNAPAGGALHVENLKGAAGEVAIRVGDNDPFGVINVGDDAKLVKLCEEKGLNVAEREFAGSLFHELDKPHSTINVLIGSKKFTEGWSSWRVSTMGLMNVGRGEGAQIIQLFGRGVRLKGVGMSLKRSACATLPDGLERPKHIDTLETLHIFGIRADYMAQFRDFLEEEGLPTNEERVEFILPIIKNFGKQPLKTIRLKKEINGVSTGFSDAFRRLGPIPTVKPPDPAQEETTAYLQNNRVVLNWYPKIQAMKAAGVTGGDNGGTLNEANLTPKHIAFLDLDRLYFDLERFKAERGWHNLNLTRSGIAELLGDTSWYRLLIPAAVLAFDSFEKVRVWQEIAQALLRKYVERYYIFRKREWELPHLEYQDIADDDPNFPCVVRETGPEYGYRILIEKSQQEIIEKLNELKAAIVAGDFKDWEFRGIKAICFGRHLYHPLLFLDGGVVEISPVPLNKGERRFVEDLKAFCDAKPDYFADRQLYLLRNLSRGRGIGFFEAGNFHPDFIIWQLEGGRQRVTFVDPKGIRNVGLHDPKIGFYKTIKEIEKRLGDPKVVLESFIVSNTPSHVMEKQWGIDKNEMTKRHILFQDEDKDTYIETVLRARMGDGS